MIATIATDLLRLMTIDLNYPAEIVIHRIVDIPVVIHLWVIHNNAIKQEYAVSEIVGMKIELIQHLLLL